MSLVKSSTSDKTIPLSIKHFYCSSLFKDEGLLHDCSTAADRLRKFDTLRQREYHEVKNAMDEYYKQKTDYFINEYLGEEEFRNEYRSSMNSLRKDVDFLQQTLIRDESKLVYYKALEELRAAAWAYRLSKSPEAFTLLLQDFIATYPGNGTCKT